MEEISDMGTGCSFGLAFFNLLFWLDYIYHSFTLGWISMIVKKGRNGSFVRVLNVLVL